MMPKKIAATTLVAVALAASATFFFWKEKPARAQRPLADLKTSDLAAIEIDSGGRTLVLKNSSGQWRLSSPIKDEIEAASVDELVNSLIDLSIGSEVSRDSSSLADYELDEAHGTRVRVYSSKSAAPILDSWFGKSAVGSSCYWRRNREPAVHLAEGARPYLLKRPVDEWRSRSLVPFSLDELETLRIEKPRSFSLTRSSGSWMATGLRLSTDKASEIVLAVSSLRFTNFAAAGEPDKKTGFGKPVFIVTVSGKGLSEKILIGKEDSQTRWAKVEGRQALGFVSKNTADALLKLIGS